MFATLRKKTRAGALGLAVALAAPTGLAAGLRVPGSDSARSPAEGFKEVAVSVAVTDISGRSVAGLAKGDFRVFENGTEHAVSSVSLEQGPVSWGLVVDRSLSTKSVMKDVYEAALHTSHASGPGDEMFVVAFGDRAEVVQDFTSDWSAIESAVRGLEPSGEAALYDAVALALDRVRGGKHANKAIIVISGGRDRGSATRFEALLAKTERARVPVYTVGIYSFLTVAEQRASGGYPEAEIKKLATVTGATEHFTRNMEKCMDAMRAIAAEARARYVVTYSPTAPTAAGAWVKLRVTASQGGKKLVVRAPSGYRAATE